MKVYFPSSKKHRVLCVVDFSNLVHASHELGGVLSIDALADLISNYTFTQIFHADGPQLQLRLTRLAARIPLVSYDASKRGRSNVDSLLAMETQLELLQAQQHGKPYEGLVLLSGDGDFIWVIELAHKLGVSVEVASFKSSLCGELSRCADSVQLLGTEMLLGRRSRTESNKRAGFLTVKPPAGVTAVNRTIPLEAGAPLGLLSGPRARERRVSSKPGELLAAASRLAATTNGELCHDRS